MRDRPIKDKHTDSLSHYFIYKTRPAFLNGSQLCLDHGGAEEHGAPEVMAQRIFRRVGHLRHRAPHLQVGGLGRAQTYLGLAAEFRSEKISRNRLGTASVIPRKKVLIPRHSEVYGRVYSEAQKGRKGHEKN
jgi:hypothetical protein